MLRNFQIKKKNYLVNFCGFFGGGFVDDQDIASFYQTFCFEYHGIIWNLEGVSLSTIKL